MKSRNPTYEAVADGSADVLVCHGPVAGYADGGSGCPSCSASSAD